MVETVEPLNIAIVRFPGSNCDFDTLRFFQRGGHKANFLWHKETKIPDADLLVLPGGFAFGDRVYERATDKNFYIEPGVQTLNSPVMSVVKSWAERGKKILGICNGFQILVHTGILPGVLYKNESGRFFCDDVDVCVEGKSFFGDNSMKGNVYRINVAHGFGRYEVDNNYTAERILKNELVFLRYHGFNPNGSDGDIAGISNEEGNVFGMMPHPERTDPITRQKFLEAIEKNVRS